jgi:chromosome condensin MukBEF complex kleisin-like MukF subunit
MADKKITKAEILGIIMEGMADNAEVVAYCENELALLESKKVKAKERADKKRAAGDELQAEVAAVLTDAPQTRDDILAAVVEATGDEELTVGKIQAKLNNLVKFGQASKCTVKTEDNKTKTAYTVFVDAE